ncbi:MAG: hypothetical protein PHP23_15075 [Desulfobacterales bacterium]|nr:hypothetical protein [Desulfobacterales bacterium]MDD4073806.1 hypothetical protein [Desulfobacterales bacterium]MDD4392841.1 hypothetical protein [Desulfobacterales bacterium]
MEKIVAPAGAEHPERSHIGADDHRYHQRRCDFTGGVNGVYRRVSETETLKGHLRYAQFRAMSDKVSWGIGFTLQAMKKPMPMPMTVIRRIF